MEKSEKYLNIKYLQKISNINQLISIKKILFDWLGIISAIFLCEKYAYWWVYFLGVIWIGARMHGIGILGHDGTHYLLFKNKKINDWVTKLALFWPLNLSLEQYRGIHFAHHKHLKTEKDPEHINLLDYEEFVFPKSKRALYTIFFKDMLGINFLKYQYKSLKMKGLRRYVWRYVNLFTPNNPKGILYFSLAIALLFLGQVDSFFWYWLVPMHTWLAFCLRLRVIGEHEALPSTALGKTRNLIVSPLEKLLLVPHNQTMHLTHHLYPSVPSYRLNSCHQELLKSIKYKNESHTTYYFTNLLRKCTKNI